MQNFGGRAHSPELQERRVMSTIASKSNASTSLNSEDEIKRKQFDPAEMFIKDWRTYRCKTWHLEPTVR